MMTELETTPQSPQTAESSGKPKIVPLSAKLKIHARAIEYYLKVYQDLRYGDSLYRYGDDVYRKGDAEYLKTGGKSGTPPGNSLYRCMKCGETFVNQPQPQVPCLKCASLDCMIISGFPPKTVGSPPQIQAQSSPANIYEPDVNPETGEEAAPEKITNPLLLALKAMGELTDSEAHQMKLDAMYNILQDLGVSERYICGVLIEWVRRLRSHITYVFEMREVYSTDIKAVFPEMLSDLETALGTCDELATVLGNQNGTLQSSQYRKLITKLLHYAEVSKKAAEQLADQHEDYGSSQGNSPFDADSAETTWVMQKPEEVMKEAPLAGDAQEHKEIEEETQK